MSIAEAEIKSFWFSGHESFSLRHGWIPKAVNELKLHPDLFQRDEALVWLGVGKNMVRSIRHWALATGVIQETGFREGTRSREISATALGTLLFGKDGLDSYLEDPATLWLLHWNLAGSKDGPTTWWWMFNELHDLEFTKERMVRSLLQFVELSGAKSVASSSISRDMDCFIRSYLPNDSGTELSEDSLECPLTDLGLLHQLDEGVIAFNRGEHPTLPPAVVAYATLDFWDRFSPHKNVLTFDQVAYQPGSPGRVFKLTENALSEHLEAMEFLSNKAITYDVTGGLKQLYRRSPVDKMTLLQKYFRQSGGTK